MVQQSTAAVSDVWNDQQQWSRAANRLRKDIRFWRNFALTFAILGAVLATAATQVGLKTGWGQGLSIAAAVMLAVAPSIQKIVRDWKADDDKSAEAAAALVQKCENVISRENESWMAAWTSKDEKKEEEKDEVKEEGENRQPATPD